jgi:DNA-binding transcriptional MerR regulator/uncharacterized protein (DUF433 family)
MGLDLLNSLRYTTAEAARLTGLTPSRIRRWLRGYTYRYETRSDGDIRTGHSGPVVRRNADEDTPYASFLDLMDLLFVKRCVDKGSSLRKVRKALEEVERITGGHHFAQRTFFLQGDTLFLEMEGQEAADGDRGNALLELLSGGQLGLVPIIKEIGEKIDFAEATGFAQRWFPEGKEGMIVVDPAISFGRPTLMPRGIPTASVFDLFLGEDEDTQAVCSWMELDPREVVAAVAFERRLAA